MCNILNHYRLHISQLHCIGAAKISNFEVNCRLLAIIIHKSICAEPFTIPPVGQTCGISFSKERAFAVLPENLVRCGVGGRCSSGVDDMQVPSGLAFFTQGLVPMGLYERPPREVPTFIGEDGRGGCLSYFSSLSSRWICSAWCIHLSRPIRGDEGVRPLREVGPLLEKDSWAHNGTRAGATGNEKVDSGLKAKRATVDDGADDVKEVIVWMIRNHNNVVLLSSLSIALLLLGSEAISDSRAGDTCAHVPTPDWVPRPSMSLEVCAQHLTRRIWHGLSRWSKSARMTARIHRRVVTGLVVEKEEDKVTQVQYRVRRGAVTSHVVKIAERGSVEELHERRLLTVPVATGNCGLIKKLMRCLLIAMEAMNVRASSYTHSCTYLCQSRDILNRSLLRRKSRCRNSLRKPTPIRPGVKKKGSEG
ncbi:hypothetical protein Tco_0002688 [Tanacetum coccineum]